MIRLYLVSFVQFIVRFICKLWDKYKVKNTESKINVNRVNKMAKIHKGNISMSIQCKLILR